MSRRCLIIGEIGVNHGGSLLDAIDLINVSKTVGADVVKFQTFDCTRLLRYGDEARHILQPLQLKGYEFQKLARHCEEVGIEFMSTPGDIDSLKFLVDELKVKRIKIGSDDLTNEKLLVAAGATNLPIILSTGMGQIWEIDNALKWISAARGKDFVRPGHLTLLHCVSLYPTTTDKANIGAIERMKRMYANVPIGYSDHTRNPLACALAVGLGAEVVEAHIKLSNTTPIDEAVSYCPFKFASLVRCIREVELLMGSGEKRPAPEEVSAAKLLRKGTDGFRGEV